MGAHHSPRARSVEWYTPPEVFKALGLEFDMDVCAPPGGVEWIPAAKSLSLNDNGLVHPWEGRVWMNPPYGTQAGIWMGRFLEHGDGVALVFARTDTPWAQAALERAHAICFVRGRINFIAGDPLFKAANRTRSASGAPSMLVACGDYCAEALYNCGLGETKFR